MRRRLLVLSAAVLLGSALAPVSARADVGGFIPAEAIDGPVTALGDLDLARDGTGAMAYVKPVAGVDHVFVSRLQDGAWQPPEQLDGNLGVSSQPVVAAGDGGRVAVAFISADTLFTTVKPASDQPYSPPQPLAAPAINPAIDLSINDVAYVSFTVPNGGGGGDIEVARKDRKATGFAVLPGALDIDPARQAGIGSGRSKIAVSADGVAIVVWGEAGLVFARRAFGTTLSAAPQDATVSALGDAPGVSADLPDVDAQDDSSFAWVVFREVIADGAGTHARAVARKLVGSQFDPGVVVDGIGGLPSADSAGPPRIDINGRGEGYAASAGTTTVFGAVLKDRVFNPGLPIGTGFAGQALPVAATDENGDGLVAWQNADLTIHARAYTNVRASRVVQGPQSEAVLSGGPTDAQDGLEAAADRAGDIAVAFLQGPAGARQLVVASFDRAPGAFRLSSGTSFRNVAAAATPLRWSQSFELWGPLTYAVEVDGGIVGQTTGQALAVPGLRDGVHRWRVIATDRRGQVTATPRRVLRQDGTAPRARLTVSGTRRRGRPVRVTARPTDANPAGRPASGVGRITISWGDGSFSTGRRATHRYGRSGRRTVRVTVRDRAGNTVVVSRAITIR
jgi:PKD domain-containing protein